MTAKKLLSVAILIFTFAAVAWGDSWAKSGPRVFAEASGIRGFKVIPIPVAADSPAGETEARGILFYVAEDGSDKVIWETKLVNIPVHAIISVRNNALVTFDTWAHMGFEHALVIYGEKGGLVADFSLSDLLTKEEIERNVIQSVSSRRWRTDADIQIDELAGHLVIKFKWNKSLTVDLKSGKVLVTDYAGPEVSSDMEIAPAA